MKSDLFAPTSPMNTCTTLGTLWCRPGIATCFVGWYEAWWILWIGEIGELIAISWRYLAYIEGLFLRAVEGDMPLNMPPKNTVFSCTSHFWILKFPLMRYCLNLWKAAARKVSQQWLNKLLMQWMNLWGVVFAGLIQLSSVQNPFGWWLGLYYPL